MYIYKTVQKNSRKKGWPFKLKTRRALNLFYYNALQSNNLILIIKEKMGYSCLPIQWFILIICYVIGGFMGPEVHFFVHWNQPKLHVGLTLNAIIKSTDVCLIYFRQFLYIISSPKDSASFFINPDEISYKKECMYNWLKKVISKNQ